MNELMQQANFMGLGAALVTGFMFSINYISSTTVSFILLQFN